MSRTTSPPGRGAARAALTRVMGRCYDEVAVLNEAARVFRAGEAASRLRQRARAREIFLQDLRDGVVALGGVPARAGSNGVKLSASWRYFKRMLAGPHAGDIYAVCARAASKTSAAYVAALAVELPSEIRLGLERQYDDVVADHQRLRRLRWGALPHAPVQSPLEAATRGSKVDERARVLEAWDVSGAPLAAR